MESYSNAMRRVFLMNRQFDFLMPSVNFFGPGVIAKIGDRAKMLNMHKPLIVTTEGLSKIDNGPVKQTIASLEKAGVDYAVFTGAEPNPKIRNVQAGKKMYQDENCDSIITVGGGSAHDCGKGIGIVLTNGDDISKLAGIETLKNVNYCTIPKLGRSYFVEEIKTVRNGVCELSCVCDVLSSFKTQLLTNDCIVEKSETKYHLYLDDGSFRVYQNPYILTKKFPSGFNNTNSQLNMVLTVATGETV